MKSVNFFVISVRRLNGLQSEARKKSLFSDGNRARSQFNELTNN